MDTRWNRGNHLRRMLCGLLAAAAALLMTVAAANRYQLGLQRSSSAIYNQDWFLERIAMSAYTLNWHAQQQWQHRTMLPSELYCASGEQGGLTEEERSEFDSMFYNWDAMVGSELDAMRWAVAGEDGKWYSNLQIDLDADWQDGELTQDGKEQYQYYLVLQFDENGMMQPLGFYGGGRPLAESEHQGLLWQFRTTEYTLEQLAGRTGFGQDIAVEGYSDDALPAAVGDGASCFVQPRQITLYYAIPRVVDTDSGLYQSLYYADGTLLEVTGYPAILSICVLVVVGAVILLWTRPRLAGAQQGETAGHSFEFVVGGLILVFFAIGVEIKFALLVVRGDLGRWLARILPLQQASDRLAYGLLWITLFLLLCAAAFCAAQLSGLFVIGPRRYFATRSWIGRGVCALWRRMTRLDLTEPGTKTLLRLLGVNFLILSVCCTVWVFGIFALLVYSLILFALLHKRYERIRQNYMALLDAADRMAQGELDLQIEGEMGLFNPLKEKLNQVRSGFKKAVETELRSRNMKTELITNVSHDLKTPLTAIITYVDLLKDETLTAEQRREYVLTLERKSLRLKQLIEDLFEVSKAATGNLTMQLAQVDLAELMRQVGYELEDAICGCGIEFRWSLPDHPVLLQLDGQRTSRIFENLILNITKYGLRGTRAYLSLREEEGRAVATLKNISAAELDLDPKQLTERFVRGDRSRNTEGSGLGLAIAKSFTEMQNGRFGITLDGDLFKVELSWPLSQEPAAGAQEKREEE